MITLDQARRRATITVPEAARLLGISQDVAYRSAAAGDLPCLKLGRRLLVPVARLLELLGEAPNMRTAEPASPVVATTEPGGQSSDVRREVTLPVPQARHEQRRAS